MIVVLNRAPSGAQGTFGLWTIDSVPLCLSCELPWLDNKPLVSCIPPGTYTCQRGPSPKFPEGDTWEVQNVEGRTGVRVHAANDMDDLEGCIAVGNQFGTVNDLPAVLNSKATLQMLNSKLPDTFTLIIIG